MPNMIPIAYLNKNFTDCNENFAWGRGELLIHPYLFWYKTKEKVLQGQLEGTYPVLAIFSQAHSY